VAHAAALIAQAPRSRDTLLARVRSEARSVPGSFPLSLTYLVFAQADDPLNNSVAVPETQMVTFAFPVFQICFADRSIMVDAGFDLEAFRSAFPAAQLTYWADRYARVQVALQAADMIVLTHEHYDHAEGVERGAAAHEIAQRTVLTKAQITSLLNPPVPLIYTQLRPQQASRYRVIDYAITYTLAPGVVLIKAPGHTPGSQLVYVQLRSGREYLLIGDVVTMMEGLDRGVQRPEATSLALREDRPAVERELSQLMQWMHRDSLIIVPSHDGRRLRFLEEHGLLRSGLQVPPT
jgi:glyoxylase-like metal-dependent hydrolase (beta-lactamase superfamily II)